MRRLNRSAAVVCVLVILSLILAACGSSGSSSSGGSSSASAESGFGLRQLTIGDLVPLTGSIASYGVPGKKAASLAVSEIEAAIKQTHADQEVALLNEDTSSEDPQSAVQAANKVVGEGATCVAGPWASSQAIPVARSVTIREGVTMVTLASANEITTLPDDGLVNRTNPPDQLQGVALVDAIEESLGGVKGKVANIGVRNDAYGTGFEETFKSTWESKGGVIGVDLAYDPDQPSYESEAQELVSGDPDVFVIADFPETFVKVAPALVRTGQWSPAKTWVTDPLALDTLPEEIGQSATEGMRGTTPGVKESSRARKAFDKLFEEAPGPKVQTYSPQSFDAAMVCYLAAAAAGSSNGDDIAAQISAVTSAPGKKFDFTQLPLAIEALQDGEDIDYEGASGPLEINEAGDPTVGTYSVFRFKNAKLETPEQITVSEEES